MQTVQIENRVGKVRLDDVVTKGLIDPLIDKIATLYGDDAVRNQWTNGEVTAEADGALERLELEIDSVGGSVAQGYRLYKTLLALRERGVEVVANVTKTAASMGSVIAMGADRVRMASNALMMIHDAQVSVSGDAGTHRQAVNDLEQISNEIAGIYAKKTGLKAENIRNAMIRETWLNAEGALRYNFVDEVYEVEQKDYNPSILERLIGNRVGEQSPRGVSEVPDLTLAPRNGASEESKSSETMFGSTELKDALATAKAKIETLEADGEIADAAIANLKDQVKTLKEDLTALEEAKNEATAELTKQAEGLTTERDEARAQVEVLKLDLEKAKEATATAEKSAGAKAAAEIAAAGHPPLVVDPGADGQTSSTPHLDKFESLNGAAGTAYFKKHREAIRAEMRSR